jgi:hypothetical protein
MPEAAFANTKNTFAESKNASNNFPSLLLYNLEQALKSSN